MNFVNYILSKIEFILFLNKTWVKDINLNCKCCKRNSGKLFIYFERIEKSEKKFFCKITLKSLKLTVELWAVKLLKVLKDLLKHE